MTTQTLEDMLAMGLDKVTYWDSMIQEEITAFLKRKATNVCLLDIGCGAGKWDELSYRILTFKRSYNGLIVGLDLSKSSVMKAKELNLANKNVNYVVADAAHVPFASQTFNTVFVIALMHHLSSYKDIHEVLLEIKRLTKDETFVFLVENTVDNPLKNLLIKLWTTHKSADLHLEGFTSSGFIKLLNKSSFQIIQRKYENLFLVYLCTVLGFVKIILPSGLISFLGNLENCLIQIGFWRYCATVHLMVKIHP
jgi:ubiquinone/menaquinone biosynthesis C-methylase UbiE